jgi:hypothetical protein
MPSRGAGARAARDAAALGVPGEQLDKVFYDIVEMEAFEARRVLVVGGGDSAVESAVGISHQRGSTVTLSYRGRDFARVKTEPREAGDRGALGPRAAPARERGAGDPPDAVILKLRPAPARSQRRRHRAHRRRDAGPVPRACGVRLVKKALAVESDPSLGWRDEACACTARRGRGAPLSLAPAPRAPRSRPGRSRLRTRTWTAAPSACAATSRAPARRAWTAAASPATPRWRG